MLTRCMYACAACNYIVLYAILHINAFLDEYGVTWRDTATEMHINLSAKSVQARS
jgi:hypothetical protein